LQSSKNGAFGWVFNENPDQATRARSVSRHSCANNHKNKVAVPRKELPMTQQALRQSKPSSPSKPGLFA